MCLIVLPAFSHRSYIFLPERTEYGPKRSLLISLSCSGSSLPLRSAASQINKGVQGFTQDLVLGSKDEKMVLSHRYSADDILDLILMPLWHMCGSLVVILPSVFFTVRRLSSKVSLRRYVLAVSIHKARSPSAARNATSSPCQECQLCLPLLITMTSGCGNRRNAPRPALLLKPSC